MIKWRCKNTFVFSYLALLSRFVILVKNSKEVQEVHKIREARVSRWMSIFQSGNRVLGHLEKLNSACYNFFFFLSFIIPFSHFFFVPTKLYRRLYRKFLVDSPICDLPPMMTRWNRKIHAPRPEKIWKNARIQITLSLEIIIRTIHLSGWVKILDILED